MGTDWFFGNHIDPLSFGGKVAALLLAVLLGGLIGLERQWHGNPAGMRTHIMVCLGSTVITLTSVEIGMGGRGGDPGHIAAQIVSGVGFLGAGAIMRDGMTVRGLTTAAGVWTTAGIGIALGASPRLGELAVIATIIVLVTLILLIRVETILKLRQGAYTLEVEVSEAGRGAAHVLELLSAHGIVVYGVQSEAGPSSLGKSGVGVTRQMHMSVALPSSFNRKEFNALLLEAKGVQAFHLE